MKKLEKNVFVCLLDRSRGIWHRYESYIPVWSSVHKADKASLAQMYQISSEKKILDIDIAIKSDKTRKYYLLRVCDILCQ